MLRVTVEIVPFGEESRKRTISTLEIGNLQGYGDVCDYICRLKDGEKDETFYVRNHERKKGAWELIRRVSECYVMPETREEKDE